MTEQQVYRPGALLGRLLLFLPALLALLYLPLADRPWPAWIALLPPLLLSRGLVLAEGLSGLSDLLASLPLSLLALVAARRFSWASVGETAWLAAELGAGLLLLAALSARLAPRLGPGLLALLGSATLLLEAWSWSLGRPGLAIGLALVLAALVARSLPRARQGGAGTRGAPPSAPGGKR
jgi:hypothetical protein